MKVLIVDDSHMLCRIVNDIILRHFQDMEVLVAYDGNSALAIEKEENPDIMLLDIVMPGISGLDVLRTLHDRLVTGTLQAIMISSLNDDDTLKSCFTLGAQDFIRKPISEVELCSRLEGAIRTQNLIKALKESKVTVTNQNDKLKQINTELMNAKNQMVQSEKLAAIGQLAAGIAHEINNPIGFISSNLDILNQYFRTWIRFLDVTSSTYDITTFTDNSLRKELDFMLKDIPELFSDTKVGVERITEIINGLRSFSRIDMANAFDYFDVNQGLKDTLVVARHRYKYVVDVTTELGSIPLIRANGGKLNQVFMNLIVNAVDAITEKNDHSGSMGSLAIQTDFNDDHVIITFKDDGIGMSNGTLQQIFDPFFTTKNIGSGTGLGLSMAYDIITNEHCGSITATSEPGVGTTFKISLPINENITENTDKERLS